MSHVSTPPTGLAAAVAARKRCRPDRAVAILESLWQQSGLRYRIAKELIDTLRTLERDIRAADAFSRGLGWEPSAQHHGFDALDPEFISELRAGSAYDRLRRTFCNFWLRHQVDLYEADDLLSAGEFARAGVLLTRVPRDVLPVPWHVLMARVWINSGDTSSAINALLIAAALRPHCRQITLLIGEAMRREGRMADAMSMFITAHHQEEFNWLADESNSGFPMTMLDGWNRPYVKSSAAELCRHVAKLHNKLQLAGWVRRRLSRFKHLLGPRARAVLLRLFGYTCLVCAAFMVGIGIISTTL
jgi:hypothetical protein